MLWTESEHTTNKERGHKDEYGEILFCYIRDFIGFLPLRFGVRKGAMVVEDSFIGSARCKGHLVTGCLFFKHF